MSYWSRFWQDKLRFLIGWCFGSTQKRSHSIMRTLQTDMTWKRSPCNREGLGEKEHNGDRNGGKVSNRIFFWQTEFLAQETFEKGGVCVCRLPFKGNRKLSLQKGRIPILWKDPYNREESLQSEPGKKWRVAMMRIRYQRTQSDTRY